jgi:hypothetical protein
VSDQASAAVGATVGLYHIIRLHASRGARNEETFWKRYGSLEAAKTEGGFARALEHAVDMSGTLVRTQSWGKAEVATGAKSSTV